MPCIVINNPKWDKEHSPGWGGPEYINFDVYNPNEIETTLQRLILFDPKRWFRYTVEVERKENDLCINRAYPLYAYTH